MANADQSRQIRAPIAIGELIDKIAILEIKAERISDQQKLRNVATELTMLRALKTNAGLDTAEMEPYAQELRSINATLWEIEDALRELEAQHDFGPHFVKLARSVYQTNDRRAGVKLRINKAFGSEIVEEKSYKGS
jgi:DNA-directed RNA polymerase sigma subunit (sigma70/sigma32)